MKMGLLYVILEELNLEIECRLCFHPNETVDDVDFLVYLADYLTHSLSSENIFATGMSFYSPC